MNKTLFKQTSKSNWIIGVIIFTVMMMYLSIIISMFDPENMEGIMAMLETMPQELMAAMGLTELGVTLTSFVVSYYYGFLVIMFPMIYSIIVANRLIAAHVERGSMAYLLATPNSRLEIVITQALFLILSITVLFLFVFLAGIIFSEILFPGHLEIGSFLLVNLITLLLFYAVSGISFFFSCLFNTTRKSLAFGAGVPVAFFVLDMLSNVRDQYSWIGNFSLFSLSDPLRIVEGDAVISISIVVPLLIALMTYTAGIIIFNRKDLPI